MASTEINIRDFPKTSTRQSCEFWLNPNGGNITSFGYPNDPMHSIHCVYRVPVLDSTVCSLELKFHDIDLFHGNQSDSNQTETIEKEFAQLATSPETCTTDYLEFNGRKKYCENDWKDRIDIVELQSPREKEFVFK